MGWAARANPCALEGAKTPHAVDSARLARLVRATVRTPDDLRHYLHGFAPDVRAAVHRLIIPYLPEDLQVLDWQTFDGDTSTDAHPK